MLTAEEARKYLSFDAETGEFVRISFPANAHCRDRMRMRFRGDSAKYGYLKLKFLGKNYQAHRMAWLLHYGEWPQLTIDHINRDRTDNRISNLRDVSQSENARNRGVSVREKNARGCTFIASSGKWQSQITVNKRNYYLGCYLTEEQAIAAYRNAAETLRNKKAA